MDRGERRRRTEKVVQKRLRIMKDWCGGPAPKYIEKPGMLRKFNLSCGCEMCRAGRRRKRMERKEKKK